jgi:autotransporter strand-loop-strand O-heptosyltransferase
LFQGLHRDVHWRRFEAGGFLQANRALERESDAACPEDAIVVDQQSNAQPTEPENAAPGLEPTSVASGSVNQKGAYPPVAAVPTQEGPFGIRYDFNQGARIRLPERSDGEWLVRLRDLDTGNTLFESRTQGAFVASSKKFYVRFRVEVFDRDRLVFEHDHDCRDREVLIQFPIGTLGDTLAWLPYADRFQEATRCRLTCALSGLIIPLLRDNYPEIRFVTHEEAIEQDIAGRAYATYSMGLFFDDKDCLWQPTDFRMVGLHRTAAYILGVDPVEAPPRVSTLDTTPPIDEPYVCIAVQASSGCKMWTNPNGWHDVVAWLREQGYRVICIDQKRVHGSGLLYTRIPHGAEDETGDRPLTERARWLQHAKAFVGLSSGLAWLAWAAGTPAVVISGFTHPTNEFATPYRVHNWHTCNSCWNDPAHRFKHDDFM